MDRLNEVRQLIKDKNIMADSLRKEVYLLEKEKLQIETGFNEGDLVQNKSGEKGILVYGRWNWEWKKLRKNGTPSERSTYLGRGEIEKVK